MQRVVQRYVRGGVCFAGAVGALVSMLALTGCPGTLDPALAKEASGGGGTGGSSATGGGSGTGGTSDCTGNLDGATLVTMNCASTFCHIPGTANDGSCGGLDLTVDANIGARLLGVTTTGTTDNGSMCIGQTKPYLIAGSTPAQGLLVDKISTTPPCGQQMPASAPFPLTAAQKSCIIQWATTLTSP